MTEVIVIALLVYLFVQEYYHRQETRKLIDRLMAKSLQEVNDVEAPKSPEPEEEINPDLIPVSEVSDDEFMDGIRDQLGRLDTKTKAKRKLKRLINGQSV